DPALAFHVAGDRAAGRLDLPRRDALGLGRLQAEAAEVEVEATLGLAVDAALVLFAELRPFRLQHLAYSLARVATVVAAIIAARTARRRAVLGLGRLAVAGLRVVFHDLALEDPDLDADDPVRCRGLGERVVDVGAQRVQRHAAFAVPFGPGDLGTAEAARDVDPDAEGTHPHGVLHGALHRPAERDPALELLGDRLGHQRGVKLRLPDLDDVEVQFRRGEVRQLLPERLDVRALLADDDTGAGGMDRHAAFLVRALDDDLRDPGLLGVVVDELAHLEVFKKQVAVVLAVGEPAAVPGPVDLQAHPDRVDLLSHYACSPTVS